MGHKTRKTMTQAPVTSDNYQTTTLLCENGFIFKNGASTTDEDGDFSHRDTNEDKVEVEEFLIYNGYTMDVETAYWDNEKSFVTFTKGNELVKFRNPAETDGFTGFIFRSLK